ncbi:MAG: radical SAM protein, partial [Bacteroidales bacterium]|nr:radical SAM protein [Bacteroidales bacterium]
FASTNTMLYENYEACNNYPVILDFKIATECNLECIMCSEYSSSAIRKTCNSPAAEAVEFGHEFIRQVSEIIPFLKEARFSGGEPFLNNIYFVIWDLIVSKNPECKISVQTNGTILNQKIKTLLESGNFHINVSVDSANPKVYPLIRRNGDFSKLTKNLKYFADYSEHRNIQLGITSCNMKDNTFELPGILNLANSLNAKLWYSDVYFPLVNALWVMNSSQLDNIAEFLENVKIESNAEIANHNHIVYTDTISRIKNFAAQAKRREDKSEFVSAAKLKNDLKNILKENISSDPELWERIEQLLDSFGNCKMIDLANEIKKYYKADFVYNQLGLMNEDELRRNFDCLKFVIL